MLTGSIGRGSLNVSESMKIWFWELQRKVQKAHDCEKCHGKIFCESINEFGITRCGYCKEVVVYHSFTKE